VRYGRFTLTGAGGFTTRRNDSVERGLDAELVRRDGLRVNLALRFDPGRRESQSNELTGMGDIDATLRARLGVRWEPVPRWQLSLGTSVDALGRGGGFVVDGGVARSFPLDARQRITLGAGLSAAGSRYLQTWYGVDERQAADSGYPAFRPRAGLRDVHASASWRIEYNPQWAAFTSISAGRLLGAAADSPLTRQRSNVSLSAGIVRRF
jgi:outer membrane scaffolding protein for murein synthesis (MipA/OmpV family)